MVRLVECHCCGQQFMTEKPHDPERDFGFGTCQPCHKQVAASWAKYGFGDRPITLEAAMNRLTTYA